jgi:hypothetical protein
MVPFVAPAEGASYVDGYSLEQSPDVVLMHKEQIPGSWAATGCAGVAIPVPLLNSASCLKPLILRLILFGALLIPRCPQSTTGFSQHIFFFTLREDHLSY